jgi:hypothetical protein
VRLLFYPGVALGLGSSELGGEPQISERVWALPTMTVYASYLDFGNGERSELSRRLLVRYAPSQRAAAACR